MCVCCLFENEIYLTIYYVCFAQSYVSLSPKQIQLLKIAVADLRHSNSDRSFGRLGVGKRQRLY